MIEYAIEAFTRKTGAIPEDFDLLFMGIVNLLEAGASFHVAAMSADSRIVAGGQQSGARTDSLSMGPVDFASRA